MNASLPTSTLPASCELCFRSLFGMGPGYCFPCDAAGRVDLDAMSESQRNHYFFARGVVGRDLMTPTVQPRTH